MDSSPSARRLPWLLAGGGLLFDIAAYYPGHISFDSAYTWWQARGGETNDTQSPMLVYLWRLFDSIVPGPGPVFLLHLLLFWGGLLLIALGLRLRPLAASMLMLLAGFAPAMTILRSHVWTDVGFCGALLVLTGALACFARTGARGWLWLALIAGFYALGLRHNALPALLPIVVYAMHRLLAREASERRLLRVGVASALVLATLFGAVQAINANVDRHSPAWRVVAVFDLGALSIAAKEVLLPDGVVGPGMDVADLTQAFEPWSASALLTRTRHGIFDPIGPGWSPAKEAELRGAWLAASVAHPYDYLAHRLAFGAALFGAHPREWPEALKFVVGPVQFRDNPPIARNASALHDAMIRMATGLRATPVFAAWPYLIVGLLALPFAWRQRDRLAARLALVLLASATLYALPLIFVAPSAELRYLFWPCVASLVAGVLAFANGSSSSAPRSFARDPSPLRRNGASEV